MSNAALSLIFDCVQRPCDFSMLLRSKRPQFVRCQIADGVARVEQFFPGHFEGQIVDEFLGSSKRNRPFRGTQAKSPGPERAVFKEHESGLIAASHSQWRSVER